MLKKPEKMLEKLLKNLAKFERTFLQIKKKNPNRIFKEIVMELGYAKTLKTIGAKTYEILET